jgi:hypothetical protein
MANSRVETHFTNDSGTEFAEHKNDCYMPWQPLRNNPRRYCVLSQGEISDGACTPSGTAASTARRPQDIVFGDLVKLLKSVLLATLASLVLPSVMRAQDLKVDILANETKVWRTFLGAHPDTAAFERLVVSDYLCIEANGVLMTKAENVAQLTHLTFSSFKIQDPQIRALSPSAALIVARVRFAGIADGHNKSGETLTSTVWVKRGNKWLAQLHTETFTKQ